MKNTVILSAFLFAVVAAASFYFTFDPAQRHHARGTGDRIPTSLGIEDDPNAQAEMEFMMLRDPVSNRIPDNIFRREQQFASTLPGRSKINKSTEHLRANLAVSWVERGPDNIGGRSRVFAADIANPGTLLAGSVAGGMWKSTDDGASWSPTTTPGQIHSTTCIAQDVRTGRTNAWYVGTGEFRGSTNNDTRWGALYRGDGIFKSTDNGSSWVLLPSTISGTPETTDNFDYVWDVATNPSNSTDDDVYAATYNGIYRSTDGGGTWTNSLVADSSYNDVVVSSAGVVYAHTHAAGATRIWRSPDGVTWTNIAPVSFPPVTGRVIIGIAPSHPDIVYFFVQGANNAPAIAGHQLWKYTYLSGDGSGNGGIWQNRGGELPSDINTQTGYDMVLSISPADTNLVIIGGTNLYRSPNGFASANSTVTIGGYPYWPGGNHHPDQHNGMFKPGNPGVFYSSHDGGLSRTDDVNAANVTWVNLDNGYNVTQFYSVSIAPDSGSNMILGGAQDNGSLLGSLPGLSSWDMAFGGDGTIVKVSPATDNRLYTQYQGGQMQRMGWDGLNIVDITPSGARNQMFVNPIGLDPHNSVILYYAGGRTSPPLTSAIWRNDDAPNATNTTGWTALAGTDAGVASGYTRTISAIGVSTENSSGVLYYGTIDGIVKRVDNVPTGSPTVTDVTPPGLDGGTINGGFVRCVAVDPANSNKALVVFGNYNFQSLWYTINGGTTWSDVEGNLAGASGPSTRYASIFYYGTTMEAFLGTSVGLLSTTSLDGASTVWVQEAENSIGNVIVGWLDYRTSDKTLAVGTHARGIWTGVITAPTDVVQETSPAHFDLSQNFPNPFNPTTTIAYSVAKTGPASLKVFDMTGKEIATLVDGISETGDHVAQFDASTFASGVYFYTLRSGASVISRKMLLLK